MDEHPDEIGRYKILGRIGHGGMATVYLGQSDGPLGFERLVAIKLLHAHLSTEPKVVKLFLDEARIAARIRHPHVVPVIEVGQIDNRYFLVMDYVHGESLITLISRCWSKKQQFPAPHAAYLMIGAAEGLHAAHELRMPDGRLLEVVHRDVSPHNFLVGYDGLIRITDFGIVKVSHEIEQSYSAVKGKVAYMSPEQALGKQVDRRTDIFALGIVAWEMLAGRRLFKAKTDLKTLQNVCTREVPRPSVYSQSIPEELDRIVLKLLNRDANERYQTSLEASNDLKSFLWNNGHNLFATTITELMTELCADKREQKRQMELMFQQQKAFNAADIFENSDSDVLDTIQEGDFSPGLNEEVSLANQTQSIATKQNTFEVHKLDVANLANLETAEIAGEGGERGGAEFIRDSTDVFASEASMPALAEHSEFELPRPQYRKVLIAVVLGLGVLLFLATLYRPSSNEEAPSLKSHSEASQKAETLELRSDPPKSTIVQTSTGATREKQSEQEALVPVSKGEQEEILPDDRKPKPVTKKKPSSRRKIRSRTSQPRNKRGKDSKKLQKSEPLFSGDDL